MSIVCAMSSIGVASAQDAESAGQPARLDTIEVTAQRRVENLQEVPASISAISEEKLNVLTAGGKDVRFLSGRIPSLNIESTFGRAFPRFYMRGLGNTDFDINASHPVSLIIDDIVQENPVLKGFPVFDLDQIEVLRGPQGTLFGRNTPAGVIKFDSVRPSRQAGGYAQLSYGRFNSVDFEGAYGGALSDAWSARASVLYQRRDDWVTNTHAPGPEDALEGYEEMAARVQFLYENHDGFEALFNLHARDLGGITQLLRANIFERGSNELVAGFDRNRVATDGSNFLEVEALGGSARLRWDLGRVTAYSITGYETLETLGRGDADGGFGAVFAPPSGPGLIPAPAEAADGLSDHSQFTQELRIESNEWGRFDWQAGAYWFDEDLTIDIFRFDTFAGGMQNGFARQRQQNQAWAVFASGMFDVSEAFELRAGLRYTRDEKESVSQRLQSSIGAPPTGEIAANPEADDVSWDLSGSYALVDNVNLYARVAKGFRAPSIQGNLLFVDSVSVADSETVLSFEAGIKADLFDKRVRLGLGVFRYTVDDQQLTAIGGLDNITTLTNAEESIGQGFEFDLEAYLTDNLLITLGSSYNRTEINDADLAIQPCGGGCTVLDPAGPVPGTVLIDGNPLPQAPRWVHSLTARWGMPLGEGELFVFTDWAYRSKVNFFLYESTEFVGDPLLEGSVRVGYNWNYGDYEIAVFGHNILDELEVVSGVDFSNLTGTVNDPRTWGVEFTARF